MGRTYCITGGCGYLGYHIGKELKCQGNDVRLFDKVEPLEIWKDIQQEDTVDGLTYIQGDITNVQNLELAFKDVDCVIHTASFGLSNRDQLPMFCNQIEEINVGGSRNVIKACCSQNVKALVYTSTHNVVFNGKEIHNGDESLSYVPIHMFTDHYSRTKSIAEQLVLISDGKILSSGSGHLRTCALRIAGLVGPKEQRHIIRVLKYFQSGLLFARFWPKETLGDYISIHNAVEGHILASNALMDKRKKETVGGQAYFLSDGRPTNMAEYHVDIARELKYAAIRYRIPSFFLWIAVYLLEMIPTFVHKHVEITAVLTRNEVATNETLHKMVTSHYFSNAKAVAELGYSPTRPNETSEIVAWLREAGFECETPRTRSPSNINSSFFSFQRIIIMLIVAAFYILYLLH